MAITKTGFQRLYKLVEFMESLPKSANKHFSMRDFIQHDGEDHKHKIGKKPTVKDLHACGTTACALGWAITVPSFRRAGLTLDIDGGYFDVQGSYEVFGLGNEADAWGEEGYWEKLFGAHNEDKTPKAWAKRARKLLKDWQASE